MYAELLKKKVNAQNFGSGLATRLTCIPLPSTNFEMMERESTIDFESDGRLKEFTIDDVMRCFGLAQNNSARARVFRLQKDGLVEKVDEFVDNGTTKAKYKKTGAVMI